MSWIWAIVVLAAIVASWDAIRRIVEAHRFNERHIRAIEEVQGRVVNLELKLNAVGEKMTGLQVAAGVRRTGFPR